jgi:archaellum component FlaC
MKKTPLKKITKKELEAMPLHTDADVKRYIGFLNEVHGDNLKAIQEGIVGMNERMDRMDQRFDQIDQRFDRMDQRFGSVDVILHEHSQILGRLMVDVEEIKSGMREKIDRKEFTALEKRMVALESYVFTGKTKMKK